MEYNKDLVTDLDTSWSLKSRAEWKDDGNMWFGFRDPHLSATQSQKKGNLFTFAANFLYPPKDETVRRQKPIGYTVNRAHFRSRLERYTGGDAEKYQQVETFVVEALYVSVPLRPRRASRNVHHRREAE